MVDNVTKNQLEDGELELVEVRESTRTRDTNIEAFLDKIPRWGDEENNGEGKKDIGTGKNN